MKFYLANMLIMITNKLTCAKLIRSGKDYYEKREQFRIRENVLHSRRPFNVPAVYESENTCNNQRDKIIIMQSERI